jgi:glycosyltransferase involved in cell wall biosynthesis
MGIEHPHAKRLLMVVNHGAFFLSHRLPIALGARADGYDVHVAAPRDAASQHIEAAGLSFHDVSFTRSSMSTSAELKTIRSLVRLYRQLRPDVVHHVSPMPILYGGLAARIVGVPAVVHAISGMGYVFTVPKLRTRAMRWSVLAGYQIVSAHPNSALLFQNADDRDTIGRTAARVVKVMRGGSGVDLEHFRTVPLPNDERPIVVLPARMAVDKGIDEFVSAARTLLQRGVNARFVLVGAGDRSNPEVVTDERLRAWVDEGVIEWWGHRTDMPEVLAKSTIVCLPSYREGKPKALMEACAVGRPIVTTDVPGNRDVVGDGTHGVIVPPRDARALAVALEALLADRLRLERMGREASMRAKDFDVRDVVKQTLEIYRTLLS